MMLNKPKLERNIKVVGLRADGRNLVYNGITSDKVEAVAPQSRFVDRYVQEVQSGFQASPALGSTGLQMPVLQLLPPSLRVTIYFEDDRLQKDERLLDYFGGILIIVLRLRSEEALIMLDKQLKKLDRQYGFQILIIVNTASEGKKGETKVDNSKLASKLHDIALENDCFTMFVDPRTEIQKTYLLKLKEIYEKDLEFSS